jgi:uncharacterized protein (DUF1810 family)
VENRGG